MIDQLKRLVDLQEIDTSILSLAEKIDALPAILKKYEDPLLTARKALEDARARSETINRQRKDKELTLAEMEEKINKSRARSSEIKTNKEYEAHLKEIESFEKSRSDIEDEILSLMEETEEFSEKLGKEEEKLKKAEAEFRDHEKVLAEERSRLQEEIEKQKARRQDFIRNIDKEIYEEYMKLFRKLDGLAVVEARDEICLGCNTNMPPRLYNDIRKNDQMYSCYYCSRFLYFKEKQ